MGSTFTPNWPEIRAEVLRKAAGKCEICGAPEGKDVSRTSGAEWVEIISVSTPSGLRLASEMSDTQLAQYGVRRIALKPRHLNGDKGDNRSENIRVMCQYCAYAHNTYAIRFPHRQYGAGSRKNKAGKALYTV